MRTASVVLGLVGGIIAIIIGLFAIGGGVLFRTSFPEVMEEVEYENQDFSEIDEQDMEDFQEGSLMASWIFMGVGGAIVVAGILGVVGGAIVKKQNIVGGILMIVGCVITFFTMWGIVSSLVLLLGGIFAFVRDNSVPQQQMMGQNYNPPAV